MPKKELQNFGQKNPNERSEWTEKSTENIHRVTSCDRAARPSVAKELRNFGQKNPNERSEWTEKSTETRTRCIPSVEMQLCKSNRERGDLDR